MTRMSVTRLGERLVSLTGYQLMKMLYLTVTLGCSWHVFFVFGCCLVLFIFNGGLQKQCFLLPYQE